MTRTVRIVLGVLFLAAAIGAYLQARAPTAHDATELDAPEAPRAP